MAHCRTPIYSGCNVTSRHPSSRPKLTASHWGKPIPQLCNCTVPGGIACQYNKQETQSHYLVVSSDELNNYRVKVAFCLGVWGLPIVLPRGGLCRQHWWKRGVVLWGHCIYVHWYISILMEQNWTIQNDYSDQTLFCVYPPETGSLTSPSKNGIEGKGVMHVPVLISIQAC